MIYYTCLLYYNSYGQLTQLHPEVDEYKMYYAQVRSDDHDYNNDIKGSFSRRFFFEFMI